jgi:hypothetical protein
MDIFFVMVIKLIRMALHTRVENIQCPPTTDGIVLMTIYGPMQQMTQWHLC